MTRVCKAILVAVALLTFSHGAVRGAEETVDWTAWRAMPVFENGRLMPLDTFARGVVGDICGRVSPKLAPPSALGSDASGDGAPFPNGEPRRFSAAELFYEWFVRPEAWEGIAFIRAEYEPLRKEVLDVPVLGDRGERLKYVSPRDVERSRELQRVLEEMQLRRRRAEGDGRPFEMTLLETKAKELFDAYVTYRLVSFNPENPAVRRTRFEQELGEAVTAWRRFEPKMDQLRNLPEDLPGAESYAAARDALEAILQTRQKPEWTLEEMQPHVAAFAESTGVTAKQFGAFYTRFNSDPPDWGGDQLRAGPDPLRYDRKRGGGNVVRGGESLHIAVRQRR